MSITPNIAIAKSTHVVNKWLCLESCEAVTASLCFFPPASFWSSLMAVTLKRSYSVHFEDTGRTWNLPESLMKPHNGQCWLQMRVSNYGLCKLLGCSVSSKNVSIKNSPGLKDLMHQRNVLCGLEKEVDGIFGGGDQAATKERKRTPAVVDFNSHLSLNVGDLGHLKVWPARKKTDDLQVALEEDELQKFFTFLKSKTLSFAGSSRSYKRSGHFKKDKKDGKKKKKVKPDVVIEDDEDGQEEAEEEESSDTDEQS